MSDPQAELKNMQAKHEFLVAVYNDGCPFESMGRKERECFIAN